MRDVIYESKKLDTETLVAVADMVKELDGCRIKELRCGGQKIVCKDEDADAIVELLAELGIRAAAVQSYESL